jgi:hypothetical protein
VLPLLEKKATDARMHLRVEVILLDFRDKVVCRRYADYRKYGLEYVQWQIMATILKLIEANKNTSFLEIDLYLSARLSTFRFDGTTDEFIVTREDAADFAARYPRSNTFFGALVNEFTWVKAEACKVPNAPSNRLPETLEAMFGTDPLITSLLPKATMAALEGSPYGR